MTGPMVAPPPPPRKLDTVSLEDLDDVVAADAPGRALVKSRDFPEIQAAGGPSFDEVQVVLFDYNSTDSLAACWAAQASLGDRATYHAVNRATLIEDLGDAVRGTVMIMLGICWPLEAMHDLVTECRWLVVLASHVSIARDLEQFVYPNAIGVVDPDMGAAALSWNFFHPGVPVPALLRAIEDAELGREALRDAAAFEDGFADALQRPPAGELFADDPAFQELTRMVGQDGGRAAILEAVTRGQEEGPGLKALCNKAAQGLSVETLRAFPAWKCARAAATDLAPTGRVAEALLERAYDLGLADEGGDGAEDGADGGAAAGRLFGAAYEVRGGRVRVVLRSVSGGPDVSEVAAAFEGCGHPTRAFFSVDTDIWDALWEQPQQVLWDVQSSGPGCLALSKGDSVVVARKGERFRESPFDEWSWGYQKSSDGAADVEGWIPTLAHTLFVAIKGTVASVPGVACLQEGDLLVGRRQRGQFVWGWRFCPGCTELWEPSWFPKADLQAVHATGARQVRQHIASGEGPA